MSDPTNYPEWFYYPSRTRPPDWVHELLDVVSAARPLIDSATVDGLTSDKVLAHLRPGLLKLGYEVEGGKHRADKIRRPVLFGDQGRERVAYEVDAVHDELGILVEVEAGRGARGNAVYRDLVRSSLIVDQRFLCELEAAGLATRQAKDGAATAWSATAPQHDETLAGLKLRGPHDLRHTFSTWLEDAGIPARVIDELMGHAGGRGGGGELERRGSLIGLRYRWTTPEMETRVVTAIEQRLTVALAIAESNEHRRQHRRSGAH